jgi:uncharacterized protein
MIIDIHTHAFPDAIAERAVPWLEEEGDIEACLDGKISSLLVSMDKAGIDISVVASICTKPPQFRPILTWSQEIASERLMPFPSIHPDDPDAVDHIKEIAGLGFRGIKLHPYYQNFVVDEKRMDPIYRQIQREDLVVLMHTGFDLAYPRDRIADPEKVAAVMDRFPALKFIASHFGAWEDWDEVENRLLGRKVYLDSSYSLSQLGEEKALRFLKNHDHNYFLFGSDSPWGDQGADLETLRRFDLDDEYTGLLLGGNAKRLLMLE